MKQRIALALLVLTMALFAVPAHGQSRCTGTFVNVLPSSNFQSIINANAAGTTYCLSSGVYSSTFITLKDGDTVISSTLHGAIFDGGNQTAQLFLSTFTPQSSANIQNVTIDGIVVRNYLSSAPFVNAAIDAGVGWTLRNLRVHNNTSGVLFGKGNWDCANGALVEDSEFFDNTHLAFQWNGTDADFRRLTFRNNGWGMSAQDAGWYGSVKITNNATRTEANFNAFSNCPQTAGLSINTSFITSIRNRAAGWWQDENVRNWTFEQSYLAFNERWGFFHEISYGGVFRNNTLECNKSSLGGDDMWSGAEVFVANSQNTVIENNIIRVCPIGRSATIGGVTYTTSQRGAGIILVQENYRNNAYAFDLPRILRNNTIRNNTIVQMGTVNALAWLEWTPGDRTDSPSTQPTGIVFSGNTYYVSSTSQSLYQHDWQRGTFATWQSLGFDTSGSSQNTGAPPTGAAPTPTITPTQAVGAGTPTATPLPTSTPTQTPSATPSSGAWGGTPLAITTGTTRLQAENFDWGAAGAAYFDTSPTDFGATGYRSSEVDIKLVDSAYLVGWFQTDEWMTYSVNVASAGYYRVNVRAGAVDANRLLRIEVGGVNRTGNITIPQISAWDTPLGNVSVDNVYLPSGAQTVRIYNVLGFLDLDYVEFVYTTGVTSTPTATLTPSVTFTPSATLTPGATFTPSTTPSPVPSNTPTPTPNQPAAVSTALVWFWSNQTAVATANRAVGTAAAAVINAQATLNAANATAAVRSQCLAGAQSILNAANASTPTAPPAFCP